MDDGWWMMDDGWWMIDDGADDDDDYDEEHANMLDCEQTLVTLENNVTTVNWYSKSGTITSS